MDKNSVVTIQLDRVRMLWFGHKAMKRWTAHTGKSMMDLNTNDLTPEEVEVLLFFMLEKDAQAHGEDLKLEQMEDLLDMAPLGIVYQKLGEAVEAAFPEASNEKNRNRAAAGIGMST